jgi:hypothetical protein
LRQIADPKKGAHCFEEGPFREGMDSRNHDVETPADPSDATGATDAQTHRRFRVTTKVVTQPAAHNASAAHPADQNRFIDCAVRFRANRVKNFFPSEWHREHQIDDVKADLLKAAGRVPGAVAT